jgi:hypothetical protein
MRFKAALDSWSSVGVVDPPDTLAFRLTCINFRDDDV